MSTYQIYQILRIVTDALGDSFDMKTMDADTLSGILDILTMLQSKLSHEVEEGGFKYA